MPTMTVANVKNVFTTGNVARICGVAPRTVSKWVDSGRLLGYRIPGSQDRRIPRDNLIKFMSIYGIPLEFLLEFDDERARAIAVNDAGATETVANSATADATTSVTVVG